MDIRTLLTETKPISLKRKVAPLSPAPSLHLPIPSNNTKSPAATSKTDNSLMGNTLNTNVPSSDLKKVRFTLNAMNLSSSLDLTVSPTDPPNAITSTVKDFFALHNSGVSFTDAEGRILIITPDNLANGMEVFVNQIILDDGENKHRKRRKSGLSSRKRTRKINVESEILELEVEEDAIDTVDHSEKREKTERILSSDVSVENIIFDSSRRRLSKFSSENLPLILPLPERDIASTFTAPRKITRMAVKSTQDISFGNQAYATPTPTTASTSASVISDEDVAIQLMRLTDPLATPLLSPSVASEDPDIKESSEPTGDEEEHSRCTRCISSKKGCDRKRPCHRCVQQGVGEADCVSDDERGSAKRKIAALRRSTMMGRHVGRPRKVSRS